MTNKLPVVTERMLTARVAIGYGVKDTTYMRIVVIYKWQCGEIWANRWQGMN